MWHSLSVEDLVEIPQAVVFALDLDQWQFAVTGKVPQHHDGSICEVMSSLDTGRVEMLKGAFLTPSGFALYGLPGEDTSYTVLLGISKILPMAATFLPAAEIPITCHRHSGETDEANCSWLHPIWPPPKRPNQDNTFYVESRASTELIFWTHRVFDVRNNVCEPRRLVCECCRDIST